MKYFSRQQLVAWLFVVLCAALLLFVYPQQPKHEWADHLSLLSDAETLPQPINKLFTGYDVAVVAWWCFWCTEQVFEQVEWVHEVIVGYAGGMQENAQYDLVSQGKTNHVEAAQIYFDSSVVSYKELLDRYWKTIDYSDDQWQFVDRGNHYRPIIFYTTMVQRRDAIASKQALQGTVDNTIRVPIQPFTTFFVAEEYHQDFYQKSPDVYGNYKKHSWRPSQN